MKKGSQIEIEISDIASNGKAVGRYEGQVVFVDRLVPGDKAKVQIFKKRKKYAEGRLIEMIEESAGRIEPKCSHFGICGGCKWQNMSYEDQLKYKQHHVEENLRKLSGIQLPELNKILPSEREYHYRNKLEFTFSNSRWLTEGEIQSGKDFDHRNALGFHVPGRFDKIVDIDECFLQEDISNQIRNFIRAYALENHLTFFDLREQHGLLRNLIIRTATTEELMVVLSIIDWNTEAESLLKAVETQFPQITSLNYVVNQKKNDTISDLDVECYSGKDHIVEKMKHLSYRIGPKSFYQTNSRQAEVLYEVAATYADLQEDDLVYDLYTGAGTIANFVASKAKKVIGIEYVEEAVVDARKNADLNGIDNTEFHAGDMQKMLTAEFFLTHGQPRVIITDPPRAGMHPHVVERLRDSGAETIVYVSCNPATQARDLQVLDEKYKVVKLQPVDMFPHTAHVENVALLKIRS